MTDYLSDGARKALRSVAERVLESAGGPNALKDDDFSPLRLAGEERAALTAREMEAAKAAGDVWEDGGEPYLSKDAIPGLTGQRVSIDITDPVTGHPSTLYRLDEILFDAGEGTRRGWVELIPAAPEGLLAVSDDTGTDWNIEPADITELRG